jgi:RNA polymerase sigma-70 factor (ECF subfamily)
VVASHWLSAAPPAAQQLSPDGRASWPAGAQPLPDLATLFRTHFDFVFRVARSLGVPAGAIDDAVQDVFLTVHRRLSEFEGRSSLRTWIYAITYRTAQNHRRRVQRLRCDPLVEEPMAELPGPGEQLEQARAGKFVMQFLETVSPDKRDVFVLCVLEELSAPEVAEILGVKLNTVYSRLRLVRADFRVALERMAAQEGTDTDSLDPPGNLRSRNAVGAREANR